MVPSRVSTPRLWVSAAPKQMWINSHSHGRGSRGSLGDVALLVDGGAHHGALGVDALSLRWSGRDGVSVGGRDEGPLSSDVTTIGEKILLPDWTTSPLGGTAHLGDSLGGDADERGLTENGGHL